MLEYCYIERGTERGPLTICYCKIAVSFSCVCPVIGDEFRQRSLMTKFLFNNRTDASYEQRLEPKLHCLSALYVFGIFTKTQLNVTFKKDKIAKD